MGGERGKQWEQVFLYSAGIKSYSLIGLHKNRFALDCTDYENFKSA